LSQRLFKILVCRGPNCGDKRGSQAIYREFEAELCQRGVRACLEWQSCFGRCTQGPNVLVREISAQQAEMRRSLATPGLVGGRLTALYNGVTIARVGEIIEGHLVRGQIQRQLIEPLRSVASTPVDNAGTEGDSET
jgi:(2Fe-2S) ferredoxin